MVLGVAFEVMGSDVLNWARVDIAWRDEVGLLQFVKPARAVEVDLVVVGFWHEGLNTNDYGGCQFYFWEILPAAGRLGYLKIFSRMGRSVASVTNAGCRRADDGTPNHASNPSIQA